MFAMYADKTKLTVRQKEQLTSGSVNTYSARFDFSSDWDGLERVAVFMGSGETRSVLLDKTGECKVPWEVLQASGGRLEAGVYGTNGENIVLPTVWTDLGQIFRGAAPGEDAQPPTPNLWKQELARKGDTLAYDGQNLSLMSGDTALSTVPIAGGGRESVLYQFGHGLKQDGVKVSVDMASEDNPDKTLPISAAAVETAVGNIEILLQTI